jgi:UDP-N-acetylmuramyl pentapeptide phosphotransferase/UDP-N-acetylglucosamine-1-phosphate transferase
MGPVTGKVQIDPVSLVAAAAAAAAISAGLIVLLYPLLRRYATARPNARSSHVVPTPQGGGIAVIVATIVVAIAAAYFAGTASAGAPPLIVFAATVLIACVGAADDIHPIGVAPRLLLQTLAVALVVYTLPHAVRAVPFLPWWIERILIVVAGVWFVNLVNFMDGLDWMTVAEVVPITAALAVLGSLGLLPAQGLLVAVALCGATLGFSYFNRPVARLFLGDVGSLPIGLLLGWLLLLVAGSGHLAAALLLPLYYLADATITLLRRLSRGEAFWQAHRTHYYQRATTCGFTVMQVVAAVFAVNVALSILAILTFIIPGRIAEAAALLAGAVLVAGLLVTFARGRKSL